MNVKKYDQNQSMMFPPHLRDFLPDDHQAVIINDIVESMNLKSFYRKLSKEGRRAYHPKMMLKILIYGYANHIFSSRKIQAALGESIAFIYLAAWQRPDFRTISDFRKSNLTLFTELFVQVVDMCKTLGMVSLGHIAIDGSKFKANASHKHTMDMERIEQAISKLTDHATKIDEQEDQVYGSENCADPIPEQVRDQKQRLKKLKQIKQQLQDTDKAKINATDTDAVFMKTPNGIKTSYNGQIAVDEKHQIIVAAQVTDQGADTDQLLPMVEQVEKNVGCIDKLSADSGYSSGQNLKQINAKGIDAHIPDANYQGSRRGKQQAPGEQFFSRDCFKRDELQDCFICPAGQQLPFSHLVKSKGEVVGRMYRCHHFTDCPLKDRCTKARNGRSVILNRHDDQIRSMRTKLDSVFGKRLYAKRKHIVEPVFGHIKQLMGFRAFSVRGLGKVNGEFSLVCITHNLRKIINAITKYGILSPAQ